MALHPERLFFERSGSLCNVFKSSNKLDCGNHTKIGIRAFRMSGLMKDPIRRALDFLGLGVAARDLRNRGRYFLDDETRRRNARFKTNPAVDGFPMPPAELIYLVTGQFDAEAFYQNGVVGATCIEEMIDRQLVDMDAFGAILDFGCGCGRVMRQWKKLHRAKLYGIDYNPRLVHWCRNNLPFARFGVNKSGTPLTFADETFDFIYSISVFTHLTESDQRFWMGELTRVLRPGGYLLFTVHGISRLNDLPDEQRQAFEAGNPIILGEQYSGTNFCGTYHPESYVKNVLCRDLRIVAFEPGGARDANQDAFLMQRPA
jgi:SAM-dependent methyltransferase